MEIDGHSKGQRKNKVCGYEFLTRKALLQTARDSDLAGDMECNNVIQVIIRCDVHPRVIFSVT